MFVIKCKECGNEMLISDEVSCEMTDQDETIHIVQHGHKIIVTCFKCCNSVSSSM